MMKGARSVSNVMRFSIAEVFSLADELHRVCCSVFVDSGTVEGWSDDICIAPVSPTSPGWNTDASTTELVVFAGSTVSGPDFAVGSMVVGDLTSVVVRVLLRVYS